MNVLILTLLAAFLLQAAPVARKTHIYLLKDSPHQQWCSFADRKAWQAWLNDEKNYSLDNAIVDLVDGGISVIKLQQESESQDSAIIDTYFLSGDKVQRLSRRMNVLPGDTTETQIFLIQDGRPKLQSTVIRRLSNGAPLKRSQSMMPQTEIITSFNGFPFASLLDAEHVKELQAKKQLCLPAKP